MPTTGNSQDLGNVYFAVLTMMCVWMSLSLREGSSANTDGKLSPLEACGSLRPEKYFTFL